MKIDDLKILLVEDDRSARATIRAMLMEMGINQIFESKTGEEAHQFMDIEAAEVDLVISDWNMPERTGLDFLLQLRKKKPMLPFIMITGRSDTNSVKEAANAGVTAYIRKPFSLQEIESKVKAIHKKLYAA